MWADENDLDNWTLVPLSTGTQWNGGIGYGEPNGTPTFVAMTSGRVMTSPDGENWNPPKTIVNYIWNAPAFGNGKFVSVPSNFSRAAYSTDGENWDYVDLPENNKWGSITYGDGKFVALSTSSSAKNHIAYSENGEDWLNAALPAPENWQSITRGGDKFVVIRSGYGPYQVAWSYTGIGDPVTRLFYDEKNGESVTNLQVSGRYGVNPLETDLTKYGIYELTEQPDYPVKRYVKQGNKYTPIRDAEVELQGIQSSLDEINSMIAELES